MKLVTFGCSWTKGVGIPYEKGMTKEEYLKVRSSSIKNLDDPIWDLMNKHSFRGILSERLGFENISFASGGSSNQRQERLATEYFNNHSTEDTVVLWGITSIVRNEIPIDGERRNIMYSNTDSQVRYHYEHFYDERTELERLGNMMIHWNKFFEAYHIPNLWFQTFNTYKFHQPIDRLLSHDLLSQLTFTSTEHDKGRDAKTRFMFKFVFISLSIFFFLSCKSFIIFSEFTFKLFQFSNSISIFLILSFLLIESLCIDLSFPNFSIKFLVYLFPS